MTPGAAMRSAAAFVLLTCIAADARGLSPQGGEARSTLTEVLRSSTDRRALERAASTLARSPDPRDLALLGQLLRDAAFLARLDDLQDGKTVHLSRVMAALAEHPSPQAAELCLTLAEDPVYLAEGDRKSFLLEVLAKVRPMSERTAALFQGANEEGYFGFNARLLIANSSPRALALFESMMLDQEAPIESRVECLHVGIVPHRIEPPILQAADRIVSRASEHAIVIGVIESVFDFRQQWFGLESGISKPPPWQRASGESRRLALRLAGIARARNDLDPELRAAVDRAWKTLQALSAGQK